MKRSKDNFTFLFWAGISSAVFAGALVIGAAGIGWLFRAPVLAGALAMIMSSTLILSFGGAPISGWTAIIVIATWAFTDTVVDWLSIPRIAGSVTLAIVYLVVGMTKGQIREQIILAGVGPMLGIILCIVLCAIIFPRVIAQSVEEAVISAAMISGARTVRQAVESVESSRCT